MYTVHMYAKARMDVIFQHNMSLEESAVNKDLSLIMTKVMKAVTYIPHKVENTCGIVN